ncbi:hypothetical protein DQ04_16401000 [Trypanosoma grayi]|uniref:hypothetical protein n=1 Tax=Trypanosoma grayi TaxID=71804 RepID=UPI0004F407A1|nr:hypothetical protein DQ04_16401000 [Trypanosoma grayi]KEG06034.1 hypothetical protein DQ04_16401000 [Trypanosoma grayi]
MCGAVPALGPTVRHAAGCLLCLLLCTRGAPLTPMLAIVPLLSATHQEILLDAALAQLALVGGDDALNDADAAVVLDIAASTTCVKDASRVESLLLAMLARHCPCVGSLGGLRLALGASCGVAAVGMVLRSLRVDALVASLEPTAATVAYVQRLTLEERRSLALSSACGFLLVELTSTSTAVDGEQQELQLIAGASVTAAAVSRLAEALAETSNPLRLVQRVFPHMHQSVQVCGIIIVLCTSVRSRELQRKWMPCVEHALLSVIHAETLQREGQSACVQERVTLFIRGLLLLLLVVATPEAVRSQHPGVCAALTQRLLQQHAGELKSVIQSLREEEATALRQLMQLLSSGAGAAQHASADGAEVQRQRLGAAAASVPQRLTINVASYSQ